MHVCVEMALPFQVHLETRIIAVIVAVIVGRGTMEQILQQQRTQADLVCNSIAL